MNFSKKILSAFMCAVMIISALAPVTAQAETIYSYGFDVSEHNESVDWQGLKAQGYEYVYIRLGYYNHLDKKFYDHVANAVSAGFRFGVYLYSYAFNTSEAQVEAQFAASTLSALDPAYKSAMTLPVAYDLEDSKITDSGLDKNGITQNALTFAGYMRQSGYEPMVYANLNWFTNYIDTAALTQNGIKLWYANYTASPLTQGSMAIGGTGATAYIWQYSSADGFDKNMMISENVQTVIDASGFTVSLSYTSTAYNGKEKKPTVSVYDYAGNAVSPQNYSVSYSSNKKPGKAKVTVTFRGIYSGTTSKSFTIKPKKPSMKSAKSSNKKQITVQWKKDSNVTGYQIQAATNSKFTKNKKTVTIKKKSTVKTTLKSLKSKKKYYVRIRSYKTVNGTKIYSSWSGAKTVKTK